MSVTGHISGYRGQRDEYPEETIIRKARRRGNAWAVLDNAIERACLDLPENIARELMRARNAYGSVRRG